MDHRSEVREFLRTRRAKVTPEQANLIPGGNRRVPDKVQCPDVGAKQHERRFRTVVPLAGDGPREVAYVVLPLCRVQSGSDAFPHPP
jgi:hypothetical protein